MNRAIDSELIGVDIKGWLMSASVSAALLLAFSIAWLLERIGHGHLTPYIDPGVLALLTLVLIPMPMPVGTVIGAVKEVLLIAPPDLERELLDLMQQLAASSSTRTMRRASAAACSSRGISCCPRRWSTPASASSIRSARGSRTQSANRARTAG
ncbi:putative Co/Zn/Cd cation transporter (cation efflux family) [Paraburkholderia sp. WSM4175]|uniref:hypothetical protein n=1 Tax=Paraburkholderia sp. WSM4175 TaxID=2991072 RepID=UPI003D214D49